MCKYTFGLNRIFEKTAVLFKFMLKILPLGLYLPSNWKLSLKAQLALARDKSRNEDFETIWKTNGQVMLNQEKI